MYVYVHARILCRVNRGNYYVNVHPSVLSHNLWFDGVYV